MKLYVGRTTERENKFGEVETQIGFTQEHINTLQEHLNDKGWVNVTLKKSKEGKPYLELYVPDTAPVQQATSDDEVSDDLPF
jgi:hypothetical protein